MGIAFYRTCSYQLLVSFGEVFFAIVTVLAKVFFFLITSLVSALIG